jgi:two-component sensor histidine kinase
MKFLFLLLFVFGVFGGVLGQDNCLKVQKEFKNNFDKFNNDYEKSVFLDKIYSENPTCHYLTTLVFDEANKIIKATKEEKAVIWSDFIIAGYLNTHKESKEALRLYEKILSNPLIKKESIYYQTLLRRNSILVGNNEYEQVYSILDDKKVKKFIDSNKQYKIILLRDLAEIKFREKKIDSVQIYIKEINTLLTDNDKISQAAQYNLIYSFYDRRDILDSALIILHKEERLRFELKDSLFLSNVYSSLGRTYYHVDNMEKAYIYHNKALEIQKKINLKSLASTYNSIGKVLIVQLKYEEAFPFLEKSLKEYEKIGDLYKVAFVKDLFAYLKAGLKYKNGERKTYSEEVKMGKEAFEYHQKESSNFDVVASGNNLCMIYLLADNPKEAQKIMIEIKKYEQEMPIEEKINIVLADIQTKMVLRGVEMIDIMEVDGIGDDLAKLIELQDSIAFQKYDKEIPRITAEAEADRAKLETLQKEKQIAQEKIEKDRMLYLGLLIFVILLSIIGIIAAISIQRTKQKKQEEQKNEELSAINEELNLQKGKVESANNELTSANKEIIWLKKSLEHDLGNDFAAMRDVAEIDIASIKTKEDINEIENKLARLTATINYYDFMTSWDKKKKDREVKDLLDFLITNILAKYDKEELIKVEPPYSNLDLMVELDRRSVHKTIICIAELVRNTIKYAFPIDFEENFDRTPTIKLELLREEDDTFFVRYQDNGVGLQDKKASLENSENGQGLGFELIKDYSHTEDFVWKNKEEGGIFVQLRLRVEKSKESEN